MVLEARNKKIQDLEQFKHMYEKPVLQQLKEQGEEENRHNTDSDQEPVAQVSVLDIPLHVINNEV